MLVAIAAVLTGSAVFRRTRAAPSPRPALAGQAIRSELFTEIQPVRVTNCELRRFGEPHDGGYPLCANLLGRVKAGYSYGISGYDGWGCEVSRRLAFRCISTIALTFGAFMPGRADCISR